MIEVLNTYPQLARYFGVGMAEFWRFWDSLSYKEKDEYSKAQLG